MQKDKQSVTGRRFVRPQKSQQEAKHQAQFRESKGEEGTSCDKQSHSQSRVKWPAQPSGHETNPRICTRRVDGQGVFLK